MKTELTINPSEGLPIMLHIEPFASDIQLDPLFIYKLVSEESHFTIEHGESSLTICFNKELTAILYRRPQSDEAKDLATEWDPYMKFV